MDGFTTPSSSRSTQPKQKWTVSPEFGDALLAAMRERSNTGGPLPRLPSMLQLPDVLTTHALSSPNKLDTAERLKMKTRVAIRDHDPHRFQVVPLRDAAKYSNNQKLPSRERQSAESVSIRGQGPVRGSLHSWKKGHANENDPTPPSLLQDRRIKTIALGQSSILSERNRNIPDQQLDSLKMPVSSSTHVASRLRLDSQPLAEQSKQPTTEQCSSVSAKTMSQRNKLHHKSTSLGNLRTKPNLDIDLKVNPLPRVASCRKHTNTLSADYNHEPECAMSNEPVQRPDRLHPVKKDSIRRHAIYTQSLYVPALERPNETSTQLSAEFNSMRVLPLRSSIPANPNKFNTFSTSRAGNALGFIDVKSPAAREHGSSLISQPSISSIYSQDQPICTLNLGPTSNLHHPIIVELLAEVEKAMLEWTT